ncbi:MAG: hypothetical protein K2L64_01375, partial [Ureaplasma sp.]|nr:hypothetical protein [Ureaplasma sp.]
INMPYDLLDEYTKIILNIILIVVANRRFNFLLIPNWNNLSEYQQKTITNKLDQIIKYTMQSFIFVIEQDDENKLDIRNSSLTRSNEITINNNLSNAIKFKKRDSFRTFSNLSKMILSIFKIPYITIMLIIFLSLFLMMFTIYTSEKFFNFEQSKIIIWVCIGVTFGALLVFVLWCIPYFKIYKNFIKTIPIANASKVTYFCYVNLILVISIQLLANLIPLLVSIFLQNFEIKAIYVSFCIFINIGFLIINLVLLSLWILLYNKR